MRTPARTIALVLLLALGAGACAGDATEPPDGAADAQALVRDAALGLTREPVEGTFSFTFDFAGDSFSMEGDMLLDPAASQGQMTYRLDGIPGMENAATMDAIVDGDDAYFRAPDLYGLDRWIHVSADDAGLGDSFGAFGGAGNDPSAFLGYLNGAEDVEAVGTEEVNGVATTHYHGTVDVAEALSEAGGEAAEHAKEALDQLSGILGQFDVSFDVWIDDGATVRAMAFAFEPREGDGGMQARLDVTSIGGQVDIEIPSKDEVVELEDLELSEAA